VNLRSVLSCLVFVGLVWAGAWSAGYSAGQAQGAADFHKSQASDYRALLDDSTAQLARSHQSSLELFARLSSRTQYDEKVTKDLRNVLAESAATRAACRFAADVMQQLDDARQRAAQAATGGLGATLPDSGGGG
jgi:hypothetical protein